jgi:hypothetical protein
MDPRTPYLSSNRNMRARTRPVQPPAVSSPVGPDGTSVAGRAGATGGAMPPVSVLPGHAQAQALREPSDSNPVWEGLDSASQSLARGGYQAGGFEGVRNAVGADDWYELPSWLRTQILAGARS